MSKDKFISCDYMIKKEGSCEGIKCNRCPINKDYTQSCRIKKERYNMVKKYKLTEILKRIKSL